MTAGGNGERAWDAPVFPPVLGFEAGRAQTIEGSLEVIDDNRQVASRRYQGSGLGHQMDLGSTPFEPGELGESGGRLDPLEAEQLEELHSTVDVSRPDLDPDVVDHRPRSYRDGTHA